MQKEMQQSKKNQNFGTVCHTDVYPTFLRWGAKLSETIAKFGGLKIQSSKVEEEATLYYRHLHKTKSCYPEGNLISS